MDVLVSGAGPIGLCAAHALAQNGLSVEIVDTGIWACSHSYALGLHPDTVDLFCKAGLADEIVSRGHQVSRVALYDATRQRASVSLEGTPPMVVLRQSDLEAGLELALSHAGVQVKWRHKVAHVEPAGDCVRVTLNRYEKESRGYVIARTEWVIAKTWTMEVPWVLGADGYHSAVRRAIGISFPEVGPSAYYAVFEFVSDDSITDEVRISLGKDTADVLWPLGNGCFRWSFELPDYVDVWVQRLAAQRERYGDPSDRFKQRLDATPGDAHLLPDALLPELIAARAPWCKGKVREILWRTVVRFERRLATEFGRGRCWLAGDAAHLGSPIAVHSLNVGLAEARDLSRAITAMLREGGSPDLLEDYNSRYELEWKRLQGIGRTVEAMPDTDAWIQENRDRLLACLPGFGPRLTDLAARIGLRL